MTRTKALVRKDPPVLIEGQELWTTSLIVAEKFGKNHKNVIRAIDNLESEEDFNRLNFEPVNYLDAKGESRRMYRISESGFMMLVMGFTGKEAAKWKVYFIAEFRRMRKELIRILTQKGNAEWQLARQEVKDSRKEMTATVKDFIEYAKELGSRHAETYYMNLSKAENKALFIIEYETRVPLRDRLNSKQLGTLRIAEQIADRALREGMDQGLHYRDIYVYARDRIEQYASLVGKSVVGIESAQLALAA